MAKVSAKLAASNQAHEREVMNNRKLNDKLNAILKDKQPNSYDKVSVERLQELEYRVKQLENENVLLRSQTKTVVAYNQEANAFEYIGEPI